MNRNLLAIAFLLIHIIAIAQSREDVIHLKNGSILKGKVLEIVPGVRTSIEIVGHNVLVFPDSVIQMILLNQKILTKEKENMASPVEMAASVNFYGGSENSGGFLFVTSYRFPFRMSTGAGIGIEWFNHQQIPFLADVRYCFLKGSWSPFIYAQGGYAVPLSQDGDDSWTEYHGGPLAAVGAGMRFNFSKHNALVFNVGYRYQKTETVTNPYPWSSSWPQYEDIRYDEFNRMTFAFGFLFK